MTYHYKILDAIGIADSSYINIHVGGAYGNKEKAIERFHENIKTSYTYKKQMTLENDDKTYTTAETLSICKKKISHLYLIIIIIWPIFAKNH